MELVLSVVIFSMYIVPIYGWISRLNLSQSKSEQYYIARNILHSALDSFRATPLAQRAPGTVITAVSQLPQGQLTAVATELDINSPSLLQYILTLNWQSSGGAQTLQVATFINNGGSDD